MQITFMVDLYMTDQKGYKAIDMDLPILPRKKELITIDNTNYIIAEIFHKIINKEQKILILLVPIIESDKTDTDISKN